MSLTSPVFFGFLAITILAFHATAAIRVRQAILAVANTIFIASYVDNVAELVPLIVFLLLGYGFVQAARHRSSHRLVTLGVCVVLLTYIFLKQFSFLVPYARLPFPYLIIGLSYILFRVIHLIVDSWFGDVKGSVGPLAFYRYTCNFLCFLSGPIQRYQDFAETDGREAVMLDADRVYHAFSRVATGYFKFVVVAASADYVLTNLKVELFGPIALPWVKLSLIYAASAASYTAYLFFNFSGYMDIVIGAGLLMGQVLPENFNRPFLARSFLEFWQRWHMTLSNWFKFYLFNPLLTVLMTRFPAPAWTTPLGLFAFFFTFLVIGIWHGTTLVFVIYGIILGLGASINKLWQLTCTRRLGKKGYRALAQTTAYIYTARGITIGYYILALTCLWVTDMPRFVSLCGALGFGGIALAFCTLALAFGLLVFISDGVIEWFSRRGEMLRGASTGFLFRNLSLATRILAILAVASLFNKAPEFVYRAF